MISSLLSSLAEAKQRTTAHVQHCWDSVGVVTICTRFEDDGCVASRRRKHQAEQHVHHFFKGMEGVKLRGFLYLSFLVDPH